MIMEELARIIQPGSYVIYLDKDEEVIGVCEFFDYAECLYKFMKVVDISAGESYSLVIMLDTKMSKENYSMNYCWLDDL